MYFRNGRNYLTNMKKIKPNQGNKTFCMAPWTHTYLSPQTERRMCCASREPAQSFKQYIDTGNNAKEYKPLTLKGFVRSSNDVYLGLHNHQEKLI